MSSESEESLVDEMSEKGLFIRRENDQGASNKLAKRQRLWKTFTAALSILCILLAVHSAFLEIALLKQTNNSARAYDTELGTFAMVSHNRSEFNSIFQNLQRSLSKPTK